MFFSYTNSKKNIFLLRTIDFQPRYCGSYNYNIHPIEYINHMHKIVKVFFLSALIDILCYSNI